MTINFNNVYLKETATVAGKDEKAGTFGTLYDKTYDDYYLGEGTFEQAEIKMIDDVVNIVTSKKGLNKDSVDVVIGADLLNQITANAYASVKFDKPFIGVYNACASMCEELLVGASLLQNNNVNNCLCIASSHNMTAERQFRNPVEYGCPKPKRATFTVTGSAAAILSKDKTNIKLTSSTIGVPTDMGVTDVYDMGSVMAPSAARTIYEHLKDTGRDASYYDLILTGDLGVYGKEILRRYLNEAYGINVDKNHEDSACIIYDRNTQTQVKAGGSGPACLPLVTYTHVLSQMRQGKIKKVLLVATGALMSPTMNNQKLSIPSVSHAISLEVV